MPGAAILSSAGFSKPKTGRDFQSQNFLAPIFLLTGRTGPGVLIPPFSDFVGKSDHFSYCHFHPTHSVDDRIVERHAGIFAGMRKLAAAEHVAMLGLSKRSDHPTAESDEEFTRRISGYLTDLLENMKPNDVILIFAHGGVLRFASIILSEQYLDVKMSDAVRSQLPVARENTGIDHYVFSSDKRLIEIKSIGNTDHLLI